MTTIVLLSALAAQTLGAFAAVNDPTKGPVNDYVGTVAIHAYQDSNSDVGHCFLTIKNTTSSPLFVGHVTLYAGQTFSVGTWNTQIHVGIFYNYEHYSNWDWIGNPAVSLSTPVTDLELETIHSALRTPSNNSYGSFFTSASFAAAIWNCFAPTGLQVTNSWANNAVYASIACKSGAVYSSSIPNNANVGYVQNNVFIGLP